MTDTPTSPVPDEPASGQQPPSNEPPQAPPAPYSPAAQTAQPYAAAAPAPIGRVRDTGTCFLLMIVTLGFYSLYWYYATHDEMRRHSGNGIGGGVALVLAIFVGIVMPFLSSNEVAHLYEQRGRRPPVSVLTGLWALLLGWFFFVGYIVWFVQTNRALNDYWRSLGAS